MNLFIIGNGFDIGHGLETKWEDFRKYIGKHNKVFLDSLNSFYDLEKDDNWNDLETTLGIPSQNCVLNNSLGGFEQIFCEKNNALIDDFNKLLMEWIGTKIDKIAYLKSKKFFCDMISEGDKFLSFNYTNTLEKVYGINCVYHIHGFCENAQASRLFGMRGQKLIIGHGPTKSQYNSYIMSFLKSSEKNVDEIMKSDGFADVLKDEYNTIYVIGCSYNEIDAPYFKKINEACKNAKWELCYYSCCDLKKIKKNYQFLTNKNLIKTDIRNWK